MVSGSFAEAIAGVPEVIDGGKPIPTSDEPSDMANLASRPALESRGLSMPDFPGLGPPDLVYVRKRFRSLVSGSQDFGYYHFIRGADVSSPACLSAYIYQMLNAGLDPAPWLAAGSWEIRAASIHSYNAMERCDAVVEVRVPGGVTASSIGPDGKVVPVTNEEFWKETHVCAMARAISNVGEFPLYPCLRAISPLPTPEAEKDFLVAASSCARRWALTGTDRPSVDEATAANSRIAVAIFEYLMTDARYHRAQTFFDSDELLAIDAELGALSARAAIKAGDFSAAEHILDTITQLQPDASQSWLARSELLKAKGDDDGALTAARKAVDNQPDDLVAWIALANLYTDRKEYEAAFTALNAVDMPPPPLDPFLRQLVPNRRNTTSPLKGNDHARSGAARTLATRLSEERRSSSSKADELLAELPAKLMTHTERDVYSVIVRILRDVGWDELLAIRGRCFVMQSDIQNALETDGQDDDLGATETEDPSDNGVADVNGKDDGDSGGPGGSTIVRFDPAAPDADGSVDVTQVAGELKSSRIDDPADVGAGSPSAADKKSYNDTEEEEDDDDDELEVSALSQKALNDIGKKVCKPWLDYLVTNMYEDLRAMAIWNAEEQMHFKATQAANAGETSGQAAAAALREEEPSEADVEQGVRDRPADEISMSTRRPPVDWLRRGELALRLQKPEEAKTAFQVCSLLSRKAKNPTVSALINLMKLGAEEGDVRAVMLCADEIWTFINDKTERQASIKTLDAHSDVAPVIRNAIHVVISKVGLNKVRARMPSRMDIDRSRLEGLLLDAVVWKVHGYDK